MNSILYRATFLSFVALSACLHSSATAQTLDAELQKTPATRWAERANAEGDAARGAVVFFQPAMACSKCHTVTGGPSPLGPDLSTVPKDTMTEALVESILAPSRVIRKGFESVVLSTKSGQVLTGPIAERTAEKITLRDVSHPGQVITLPTAEIEEIRENAVSLMPAGQMNQLTSAQQFLDLVKYLV